MDVLPRRNSVLRSRRSEFDGGDGLQAVAEGWGGPAAPFPRDSASA